MKKTLSFLIFLFLLCSCEERKKFSNDEELCLTLAQMTDDDQKIRRLAEIKNPFFEILDSLRNANGLTLDEYSKLPKEEQLAWGKIAREIANKKPKTSKEIEDSLWNLQIEIDHRNTKKLIEITEERGWVSKEELGCSNYIAPVLIFRHAPDDYWEKIRELINKEFNENRMGEGDYLFISNHLNGRSDFSSNF